ncbi:ABC transporter permease protein [Methanobrevibacter ruminantium M1]|uniref:ABC transporter permease protein n=1 Tax=Methanobrevibacter ruminantium (strain ATCC 35063 / DSM 1093 / JCM 13430 / OCM 146 / M1) TaxID=634498 RepID=D3E4F9_METRM|nr:ABC transporter permease [Methanobrevibacter ruminantium]ADC45855.1 ABC transporter permease protein [Methanobrevibacter ruminantium M1]
MLKRKMLRDIWNYKVQFISIFIIAFIGVFVFAGLTAEADGFEASIDSFYQRSNLADGWIYSNYLVDDFLKQVYLLGATTSMERQLVVDSQAELDGKPDITLHFVENNTISKYYPLEGNELNISDSEGVWLDKTFADARNLKIGDTIAFESNGIKIEKKIRGLGYSPENVYSLVPTQTVPNYTARGFAYMSYKAFPSDNITYNVLNVKFDGRPEIFSELLSYRLDGYYELYLPQSNQYSVNAVSDSIAHQSSLNAVFPILFTLISMLMLSVTMKRIISNQRTQIGVLKANGFSNRSIAIHYMSFGFLLVTSGSILGAILGPIVFHFVVHESRIYYFKFPVWAYVGLERFIFVIVIISLISLIVSYLSIKSIVNEPPSQIIKPKPPKMVSSGFIEKLAIWKRLSFNIRWNYRDIKRNRFKSLMTIVGVMGCTILLISGFAVYEQMEISKDWYFNDVNHFESKLVIDDNTDLSQIDSIAHKVNGDEIMESSIEILKGDANFASLLVLNDTDLITMTNDNREKIDIPKNEVSISKKMADILDLKVGDTIDCHLLDSNKLVKIRIDRIHSTPFTQGLVMSADKYEELGFNFTPTSIITSEHVNKSYDGVKSTIYSEDMVRGWDQMQKTSMMIITSILFLAIVLAVVILYNMNLLSFIEMENDIATLKVLGFKSKYLTKLLATQGFFFIIVGFILGLPVAYYILTLLMPAFGNKIYLIPNISVLNMAFSFLIIVSVFIVMNLYFSRKIRKLDMVDALKTFE